LYLNVWTPAAMSARKLPVMVWIYGGALKNGSGAVPIYAGDRLVQRGVVVVTFNYRLGALGFLAHPALSAESEHGTSGNYGLLDQIAALQWVQRNIAAFGGDPDNVTIFGQSSGSISVSALTVSPLAKGLFHKAIGQSGALFEPLDLLPAFRPAGADAEGARFAEKLGAQELATLRALPVERLLEQAFSHFVIDGRVLPQQPYEAYATGNAHAVPLLVGSTDNEGGIFLIGQPVTRANFDATLAAHFPSVLLTLIGADPGPTDNSAREAALAIEGDLRFNWNMWTWARLAARHHANVYLYRFTHRLPYPEGHMFAGLGAPHGAEMPFVFDQLATQDFAWTGADRALADTVAQYWTNFAKSGDPNADGLPAWPPFMRTEGQVMMLSAPPSAVLFPETNLLRRIDRVYATIRFVLAYGWALLALGGAITLGLFSLNLWRRTQRKRRFGALVRPER
jgi:para-nitrobenzyl esterase